MHLRVGTDHVVPPLPCRTGGVVLGNGPLVICTLVAKQRAELLVIGGTDNQTLKIVMATLVAKVPEQRPIGFSEALPRLLP